MGFKFQPLQKITFPIVDENDQSIKTYTLDVGSDESFRTMTEKGRKVVELARGLESGGASYDEVKAALKDFIDGSLGAGEYDYLYKTFNTNIFALIELSSAISFECKKTLDNKMKANAALYG
jgi:hypothetical protein